MATLTERLDDFQRRHRWAGFPLAVLYKFIDDLGSYQAALLTYYGFVSLFPLLLLAVTVLGFVLAGNPAAQQAVLNSALQNVPIIGQQIGANVHSLHGSVPALVIGIVVSLYGALGITQALFSTMSQMWAVPVAQRPGMPVTYARGLLVLLVLGLAVLVTTGLSALSTAVGDILPPGLTVLIRVAPPVVAVLLNTAVFLAAFKILTPKSLSWRQLGPGAVTAAVGWQVLQLIGTYLIGHELQGMSASYGFFGIVLGLLVWIYLSALVVLISIEINTVRVLGLAPRSLLAVALPDDPAVTEGDRRAYRAYAQTQRHKTFESIEVHFDHPEDEAREEPHQTAPPPRTPTDRRPGEEGPAR